MVGEKELLELTVKELRLELGRQHMKKSGVKAEVQARLKKALVNEAWDELAVSHWHLAVCSCELPRLHRGRKRPMKGRNAQTTRRVEKRYGTVNYTVPAPISTTNLVSHMLRRQSLENSSG